RNKRELIYHCQERTLAALHQVVQQASQRSSAREQLRWLIHGHLQVLLDEQALGPAHLDFTELPATLLRKVVRERDRYETAVRQLIARGQKGGQVRGADPKLAAFALLGALNWAARWFHPSGEHSVAQVASLFSDQLLYG